MEFCLSVLVFSFVLAGMETIGQLAWCLHNESALSRTPPDVYQRMVQLLLVLDCQLILTSLDALYNLSFYGEQVARAILDVAHSVETLVHLLTVTVEDMGASAVEGLSLVHVNGQVEPLVKENKSVSSESDTSKTTSSLTSLSMTNKPPSAQSATVSCVSSTSVRSSSTTSTSKLTTAVSSSPVMTFVAAKPRASVSQPLFPSQVADKAANPGPDMTSPAKTASRFNGSGSLTQKSLPKELFATEW